METIGKKTKRKIFLVKIDLPALLAILFFAGLIFLYLIPGFEKVMMERKRNLIHEMTSSAYSLLEYYHSLENKGDITTDDAKEAAKSAINAIRYGDALKDYFWITDMHPKMIVHPYRPELNGTDLSNFKDSRGETIFVEFVKAVSISGESYIDYMWQWNDDSTRVASKLSYVRLFEPWGWIIGTGIYVDDVRTEIRRMEFRALTISMAIGLLILLLLMIMTRQGHRIEAKRTRAEEELHKSKELYRTLAEAASDGVLIWSSQGIQANKTLLSWLKYTESELPKNRISEIISADFLNDFDNADQFYDELSVRKHSECVLIQKDNMLLKCYSDFSRIQLGGLNAVLIVIRPLKSLTQQSGFQIPSKLLENINSGFFRTNYGKSLRFISATPSVVSLFGFKDFSEMSSFSFESLFADPHQLKMIKNSLLLKKEAIAKVVELRRNNGSSFQAMLSVLIVENNEGEICCEGTLEHLAVNASEKIYDFANLNKYSASYFLKGPITGLIQPIETFFQETDIIQALSILKVKKVPFAVVVDSNNESLGLIDASDIALQLLEGGDQNKTVGNWMKTPLHFIQSDKRISEALYIMRESSIDCLLVKSDENKLLGFIMAASLVRLLSSSSNLIKREIESASTVSALQEAFLDSREFVVSMVIGNADVLEIAQWFSSIADQISQKTISLCIEAIGPPPCKFAFFQTGSAGRMEQTLSTDQDNAIVFENVDELENEKVQRYFLELGQRVNTMLDQIGFRLCKGNNMAGNKMWCQSLDSWKKYFSGWINSPGPDELLEVSIFFDFRFCYGEKSLIDELRSFVTNGLKTNDIFFRFMALSLKPFNPSLHLLSLEKTDTKKILMPLTGIIRLYTLKYYLSTTATFDRLIALYDEEKFDLALLRALVRSWKSLMYIRLIHQAANLKLGIEPDNMVNFKIEPEDFRCYAEEAIESINTLMLKVETDFHTESF